MPELFAFLIGLVILAALVLFVLVFVAAAQVTRHIRHISDAQDIHTMRRRYLEGRRNA